MTDISNPKVDVKNCDHLASVVVCVRKLLTFQSIFNMQWPNLFWNKYIYIYAWNHDFQIFRIQGRMFFIS